MGITIGKGNKLGLDEDTLKKANIITLKSLFTGAGSFADKISQKAGSLSSAAANATAKVKGTTYTNKGGYSATLSKLFSSTVDETIGSKDKDRRKNTDKNSNKNSDTSSKNTNKTDKKEEQEKKNKKSERA